jgi:hypothetical protein
MATKATKPTTERRSPYPPEHPPQRRRLYFDDTLDAYPPLRRLFPGKPTPEAMEAARQLADKRGYPMPHFLDEAGKEPQPPGSAAPPVNGALAEQPERDTGPHTASTAREK